MFVVFQGINKIWSRLFDHRGFLEGEIIYFTKEFEKRSEEEVDHLFAIVENITDIRYTHTDRFKQAVHESLPKTLEDLNQAIDFCKHFVVLEEYYRKSKIIENKKQLFEVEWQHYMDKVTSEYSNINSDFEKKEEDLREYYLTLEKALRKANY